MLFGKSNVIWIEASADGQADCVCHPKQTQLRFCQRAITQRGERHEGRAGGTQRGGEGEGEPQMWWWAIEFIGAATWDAALCLSHVWSECLLSVRCLSSGRSWSRRLPLTVSSWCTQREATKGNKRRKDGWKDEQRQNKSLAKVALIIANLGALHAIATQAEEDRGGRRGRGEIRAKECSSCLSARLPDRWGRASRVIGSKRWEAQTLIVWRPRSYTRKKKTKKTDNRVRGKRCMKKVGWGGLVY